MQVLRKRVWNPSLVLSQLREKLVCSKEILAEKDIVPELAEFRELLRKKSQMTPGTC